MAKTTDKKFQTESKYNRSFSEEFRKTKVKEIISGVLSVRDLCRLYGLSRTTAYKWIYLYSGVERGHKTVVQMESEGYKTKLLQQRVAELERIVGQKQMEIDYLNVCFEVTSEALGYDVKKKHAPAPWNAFEALKAKDVEP